MRQILAASAIVLAGIQASPAYAQEGAGSESVGTINITVVIPPLGEAVAAQAAGATGLWSILNGNEGLMIDAPATIGDDADLVVDLFSADSSQLQIRSFAGNFAVRGHRVEEATQLRQTRLSLPLGDPDRWTYNPLNPGSKLYIIGTV